MGRTGKEGADNSAPVCLFQVCFSGVFRQASGAVENLGSHAPGQGSLSIFCKGFLHCRAYEQLVSEGSCRYTAPLLSYVPELTGEKLPPVAEDFWKTQLENLPEELLTLLRQDETYASLFE